MIITEEVYLEHAGVKGMRWGVRKQQAITAGKAVGRGTKRAAIWSKEHPKEAALITAGSAYVLLRIKSNINLGTSKHISNAGRPLFKQTINYGTRSTKEVLKTAGSLILG